MTSFNDKINNVRIELIKSKELITLEYNQLIKSQNKSIKIVYLFNVSEGKKALKLFESLKNTHSYSVIYEN